MSFINTIIKDKKKLFNMSSAIKMLSSDALNISKAGHLGTAIGASDLATCLFANFLSCNPKNPLWFNRDRFVLSAGHAAILQYSTLHLLGYEKFTIEALQNLRKKHSITSGHPEYDPESGIEVTTGPLGQGVGMSVGLALGERILNSHFPDIIDHFTYVLVGDGCLQEGVSYEALSLAANLGLSRLIVIYDYNNITIDGKLEISSIENVKTRMLALGFNIIEIDGHNYDEINNALFKAKTDYAINTKKPTIIISKSKIAHLVPNKEGTPKAHGGSLSQEELEGLKKNLNWTSMPFEVPENIKHDWKEISVKKIKEASNWEEKFNNNPEKQKFLEFISRDLSNEIQNKFAEIAKQTIKEKPVLATRIASSKVLETICENKKSVIGGSADLGSSNGAFHKFSKVITEISYDNNYIHYGIREHAMACCLNGLSCYGLQPYGATFLVFSDYMRPAIRLSALMKIPSIYVFTHDNISLGGDGPTHQPIEHLSSLRLIPNLQVLRPCDTIETIEAYKLAFETKNKPTAIILGRDNVKHLREDYNKDNNKVSLGAYFITEYENPDLTLFSSGSELFLTKIVSDKLLENNIHANVVSVPNLKNFVTMNEDNKKHLINEKLNIVFEAGTMLALWANVLKHNTFLYGIEEFGLSADGEDVMNHFGFTVPKMLEFVKSKL